MALHPADQEPNVAGLVWIVQDFLPQDFRGSLVQYQNKRSEAARKTEMEKLFAGGGALPVVFSHCVIVTS